MRMYFLCLALGVAALLAGVHWYVSLPSTQAAAEERRSMLDENGTIKGVTDYGNGLVYFDSDEWPFSEAYSAYLDRHPEFEFAHMDGFDTNSWEGDDTFRVIFRERTCSAS